VLKETQTPEFTFNETAQAVFEVKETDHRHLGACAMKGEGRSDL
jgi:hypothetical protein